MRLRFLCCLRVPDCSAHAENPSFHFEGDDSSEEGGGNADELLDSAWKALEYARVIYEERKSQPIELSDVHLALGEFCQEMEQPQSETIGEYTKALVLRQSLPDDTPATASATSKDRLLAEACDVTDPLREC